MRGRLQIQSDDFCPLGEVQVLHFRGRARLVRREIMGSFMKKGAASGL